MSGTPASGMAAEWAPIDTESLGLPRDIISLTRDALRGEPTQPVFIFEDGVVVTRERFRLAVEQFAGYLSSRVEPGDRVLIMLENRTEFMVAWLAVNACGASLVSINTSAREHDAGHIVRDSAARIAIVGPEHAELIERCRRGWGNRGRGGQRRGARGPRLLCIRLGASCRLTSRGRSRGNHQRLLHLGHHRSPEGLHGGSRLLDPLCRALPGPVRARPRRPTALLPAVLLQRPALAVPDVASCRACRWLRCADSASRASGLSSSSTG